MSVERDYNGGQDSQNREEGTNVNNVDGSLAHQCYISEWANKRTVLRLEFKNSGKNYHSQNG